jgi:hypothetical protein
MEGRGFTMNIDEFSLDCLQALSLAVTHKKEIFDFDDIKSIRETCKALKHIVDNEAFICTKLKIAIGAPPLPNLKAIAASPLLQFIRHLELEYKLDDQCFGNAERLPRYVKRLLNILQQCAPKLASLNLATHLPPQTYSFGRRMLRGELKFPALKH